MVETDLVSEPEHVRLCLAKNPRLAVLIEEHDRLSPNSKCRRCAACNADSAAGRTSDLAAKSQFVLHGDLSIALTGATGRGMRCCAAVSAAFP
jgi:hypothetical protein